MELKIGINGFGRIGRLVHRALLERGQAAGKVVAINGTANAQTCAYLLRYDSTYGPLTHEVRGEKDALVIGEDRVEVFSLANPSSIPWGEWDVDIVVEASGKFKNAAQVAPHLSTGPKKVLVTCPLEGADRTLVLGVNEDQYVPEQDHLLSASSCTTNCLAPVCKVLQDRFLIESATATTVHAYTNDQKLLDGTHKDLRRARSAAMNIIPTSTGAAKALFEIMPDLKGKIRSTALRVPVSTVSALLLHGQVARSVNTESLHRAFLEASARDLKGILRFTSDPVVSSDLRGDAASAIIDGDANFTFAGPDGQVSVFAWYDNEWAYACRVVDLITLVGCRGLGHRVENLNDPLRDLAALRSS